MQLQDLSIGSHDTENPVHVSGIVCNHLVGMPLVSPTSEHLHWDVLEALIMKKRQEMSNLEFVRILSSWYVFPSSMYLWVFPQPFHREDEVDDVYYVDVPGILADGKEMGWSGRNCVQS